MTTHEKKESKHTSSYLRRVQHVMEEYQRHKRDGVMDIWIFRTHIKPKYLISYRTFKRYLDVPATRLLRELEEQKNEE